ncbi:WXG100 family type VII secretion target [Umezawaea tangerina]|uniref:Excreted virulence factor EspC (Type VII ESX diderm) n=1 Tax=Umezawaea tangerina TaxID=84725 RepID=A0A2T0T6Z2_9PSEU|nr:type VII secretion target [Umezawaea tangerina]PRY41434.1 excreted virulence factor EspC (type VII ESX diderm) [Umezawaea tangerina]
MSGFDVDVGEVRAHAEAVSIFSDQVDAAGDTARAAVGGDAFGLFGASFASALVLAADQVRDAIAGGAVSLTDVRVGLRETADLYQQVDEAQAQLFRGVDGEPDHSGTTSTSGAAASGTGSPSTTRGMPSTTPVSGDRPFQQGDVIPAKLGRPPQPSPPGQRAKAVAVLQRIAEEETRFWNSDRGNWVGSLMPASMRYSMLVSSRDSWLAEFPPAERDRIARQLGVRPGG